MNIYWFIKIDHLPIPPMDDPGPPLAPEKKRLRYVSVFVFSGLLREILVS
jgi:hypothetical protein